MDGRPCAQWKGNEACANEETSFWPSEAESGSPNMIAPEEHRARTVSLEIVHSARWHTTTCFRIDEIEDAAGTSLHSGQPARGSLPCRAGTVGR